MLTCHNCMRRCLQTLIGDSAIASTLPRATFARNTQRQSPRSLHTTVDRQPYPARFETLEKGGPKLSDTFKRREGQESTSQSRQTWLESRGKTPIYKQRQKEADDPLLRRQLKHLKDPLKLAEHVRTTLREDDFESALAIVRAASKDTQCVVSWNHLIDWQLSKHKMREAIKTYNEMKKRAQTPDAYTYTIIFRGCADHPLPAQALAKVITIYTSMLADNAPVRPNTIHMNAILKMCARADDMEALFAISDHMPGKGIRAPNMVTYSIVLNAIRTHAFTSLRGDLTVVQRRQIRQDANRHARRSWSDVIKRWRQGDFMIDESLVCSMGRILLLGVEQDVDDVLSLVEQTMNVPRQAAFLKYRSGQAEPLPLASQDELRLTTIPQDELSAEEPNPFTLAAKSTGVYVKPGPNTLSLVMEALLDLRLSGPASTYWDMLINRFAVDPDANNYHAYLRVLRLARASTATVKLLLEMPASYMDVKTFRIAMSTCRRDGNNQHAFANAGKVLDIMQTNSTSPDPKVLTEYLDIAFSVSAFNKKQPSDEQDAKHKYEKGRQIMRAIERLNPSYLNLRSLLAYGDSSKTSATNAEKQDLTNAVLELSRNLVRAHDIILTKQLVSQERNADLTAQRNKLAAFITRFTHKKNGIYRSATAKAVTEAPPFEVKIQSRDFKARMAAARKEGPKAYTALRAEFAAQLSEKTDRKENATRNEPAEDLEGKFKEKFAEKALS
ncbi:Pentatricopeptide repeat-containing [Hyphodiscus hymeniophilus]|uniref:Pentatricopeptide repeat-containing n=1 Tax=Hyphodiscus hymeniophilus TaxID=353542 RepID=A0A9P6VIE7_9HELO|nr:Pentatricopeptide repeat-containing [Hyphodiscus hymeniophilus]